PEGGPAGSRLSCRCRYQEQFCLSAGESIKAASSLRPRIATPVGYAFCDPLGAAYLRRSTVNLAYRWFCKLGIEDSIPDHSVFCRARHERFRESDALRQVFESVVAKCIAAGLVGGEAFSIDVGSRRRSQQLLHLGPGIGREVRKRRPVLLRHAIEDCRLDRGPRAHARPPVRDRGIVRPQAIEL